MASRCGYTCHVLWHISWRNCFVSPWGMLLELEVVANYYIHQVWNILPSPSPQLFMDVSNGPPRLNPLDTLVIQWHILKDKYAYYRSLKALVHVWPQYCNLVSRFNDTTMWRRIHRLGKPPCATLCCCATKIPWFVANVNGLRFLMLLFEHHVTIDIGFGQD